MSRPLSSFEYQTIHGRMPTKDERSAYSSWRARNPTTCLVCGYDESHPGTPGCQAHAERAKQKQAELDMYRYDTEGALVRDVGNLVGADAAEAIKALIRHMIDETLHPRNEE